MITYQKILNMAGAILDSDDLDEKSIVIEYKLNDQMHFKLNEELYIRSDKSGEFKPVDIIDLDVGGVHFRFIK